MRILVTGGSGFIGSHVVDKLIDSGNSVSIFDVETPLRKDVKFVKGNIMSLDALKKAMKGIDYVFHIAAFSDVNFVAKDPIKTIKFNILGTANILEAARKNDVKRVLFASSVFVYGERGHLYNTAKKASEMICKNYNVLYGLPFTILRYATAYGPRSRQADVISIFVKLALAGKDLMIHGTGKQVRNFIFVEDLGEGNVAALKEIAKNQTYDLIGAEQKNILEIAKIVKEFANPKISINFDRTRIDDYQGEIGSLEKAEKELGWQPKTDLKTGIKKYIEWYRKSS